jgi:hypothetical protein
MKRSHLDLAIWCFFLQACIKKELFWSWFPCWSLLLSLILTLRLPCWSVMLSLASLHEKESSWSCYPHCLLMQSCIKLA